MGKFDLTLRTTAFGRHVNSRQNSGYDEQKEFVLKLFSMPYMEIAQMLFAQSKTTVLSESDVRSSKTVQS